MVQTCRICLRSDNSIINDVQDYVEIIKNIAQIELIIKDEYPSKVCNDCSNDLLNAQLLREMLLECNETLVEKIPKTVNDEDLNFEYVEIVNADNINELSCTTEPTESVSASTSKKKTRQGDETVVLRDEKRKVRAPVQREPQVEEIDAGLLKKEYSYACHYCNTLHPNLETHMTIEHPDEPLVFHCRFCDNIYQKFISLKDHVYKIHRLIRKIPCDECGMKFSLPCRLKEHKMKAHSEVRNFVCTFCNARFKLKTNLNNHMKIHTGEKRYKCEYCEKAYVHYSDWKSHHMSHTGDWRYKCDKCNKGFYKPSALKLHYKSHIIQ